MKNCLLTLKGGGGGGENLIYFYFYELIIIYKQHAKEVVSNTPGLVGFALGLRNSILNLPDGQVTFFVTNNFFITNLVLQD